MEITAIKALVSTLDAEQAALFVLSLTIVFVSWLFLRLLHLERGDKVRIISEYEDKDMGKLAKQRHAHTAERDFMRSQLDAERGRGNKVHELRNQDAEKITESLHEINTVLAVIAERLNRKG